MTANNQRNIFTSDKLVSAITDGGMVVDPYLRLKIAELADALATPDQPTRAVNFLGFVTTPAGDRIAAHLRHAVDVVIIDRKGNILLVEPAHNPSAGKLALPGGFIDPDKFGTTELAASATLRELAEETHVILPTHIKPVSLGRRRSFRPFDVREASENMPDVGIHKGEFFAVTTKPYGLLVDDISKLQPKAGDDAHSFAIKKISALGKDELGIYDHSDFIALAVYKLDLRDASIETTTRATSACDRRPGVVGRILNALRLTLS